MSKNSSKKKLIEKRRTIDNDAKKALQIKMPDSVFLQPVESTENIMKPMAPVPQAKFKPMVVKPPVNKALPSKQPYLYKRKLQQREPSRERVPSMNSTSMVFPSGQNDKFV